MIPSEHALVESYGVSRGTVRAALALLTSEGLIETISGRGRRVVGSSAQSSADAAYARIAADLRSRIRAGEFSVDMTMPSETELVAEYGVSRNTVRRAYKSLVDDGLVVVRQGSGASVHEPSACCPPAGVRRVTGDTSPSVSHTNAAATPASRVVTARGPSPSRRRATRSHLITASNSGTTHDGRTSVDTTQVCDRPPTIRNHQLPGLRPDPALPPAERTNEERCGGRLLGASAVARSPGGMPHRRWGRKRNSVLAPPPPVRPCCARPTDGGASH
jgi:DNA-binding GntR family transcriptional regulator